METIETEQPLAVAVVRAAIHTGDLVTLERLTPRDARGERASPS